uniref:Uncharacterized protein n=1 Tax=Lepeophtheirus salmonis TaxID=72036 RepID=A0A0K2TVA4_LEPSM
MGIAGIRFSFCFKLLILSSKFTEFDIRDKGVSSMTDDGISPVNIREERVTDFTFLFLADTFGFGGFEGLLG